MSNLNIALNIKAVSSAMQPLKRTQAAVKKLQDQAARVTSYRKSRQAFLQSSKALRQNKQALTRAKRAYSEAVAPSKKLKQSVERAARAVNSSRQRVDQESRSLNAMKRSLKSAGINTSRLGAEQKRIAREIERANHKMTRQSRLTNRLSRGGIRLGSSFKKAGRVIGKVGIAFGWAGLAIAGLRKIGQLAASIVSPFVKMSTQLEDIQARITALSHGNKEAGKSAMKWLGAYTDKNPARPITEMAQAFIQLKQYGMDAKKALPKLNDYNVGIGGDQQNLTSMIDNLNQIELSGRFSGRALARLSRNGIDAAQLLSDYSKQHMKKAMTPDEIRELAKNNKLGSDAIDALIQQMGESQKGAAKAKPTEWNEMLSSLSGSWEKFKLGVMDSGPFRIVKGYLSDLSDYMRQVTASGQLKSWATTTGKVLVGAFAIIRGAFKVTMVVAKALWAVIKALASPFVLVYKVAHKLGEGINFLINKVDKLFDTGLGKLIGKGVAFLMAGLGSDEAKGALNADAAATGRRRAQQTLADLNKQRVQAQPHKGGTSTVHVNVNDNRTHVTTRSDDPDTEVETTTGRNLVGVMP